MGISNNIILGLFLLLWLLRFPGSTDGPIPPNIDYFTPFLYIQPPKPLSSLPTITTSPRQETTADTTSSSNLEGYMAPLTTFLFTT